MPEIYGTKYYLWCLSCKTVAAYDELDVQLDSCSCDSDVYNLALFIMQEKEINFPSNAEGYELYLILRRKLLICCKLVLTD